MKYLPLISLIISTLAVILPVQAQETKAVCKKLSLEDLANIKLSNSELPQGFTPTEENPDIGNLASSFGLAEQIATLPDAGDKFQYAKQINTYVSFTATAKMQFVFVLVSVPKKEFALKFSQWTEVELGNETNLASEMNGKLIETSISGINNIGEIQAFRSGQADIMGLPAYFDVLSFRRCGILVTVGSMNIFSVDQQSRSSLIDIANKIDRRLQEK